MVKSQRRVVAAVWEVWEGGVVEHRAFKAGEPSAWPLGSPPCPFVKAHGMQL